MKNITLTFLIILFFLIPILVSAQQTNIMHQAPSIFDKPTTVFDKNYTPGNSPLDGNYIGIDTMTNALSFAETGITPLYFDPYSGVLALVHRGWFLHYASSTGQIWYNISTDYGVSWKRVPGGVNTPNSQLLGRYPNMTISNPTRGSISATKGLFVWPELLTDLSKIGYMGYAADQPLGTGTPASALDLGGDYGTKMMAWADDRTSEIFWTTAFQSNGGLQLFRSNLGIVQKISPPQWNDTVFQSNGNIGIGSYAYNGVEYVGAIGPFSTSLLPDPPSGGWLVGYSKSTDKGNTWANFKMADWRKIPKFAHNEILFDYKKGDAYVAYQGSIGVDKNNHVHIIVSVTDTTTDKDHGTNSIIDIFETSSGWDGTIVYAGLDTAYSNGPGIGQVGPAAELAFDSTHSVMAVQFINTPSAGSWNDIFFTYKGLDDTLWSTPVNLTNSATSINHTSAHLAPYLNKSGTNQYTAFSAYCYSPAPFTPTYDGYSTAVLYAAPHTFTYTVSKLSLTALIQGFYNGNTMVSDTVTVELHNTSSPYTLVQSQKGILNSNGVGTFYFTAAADGTPYYLVIKHRNAVETWSEAGQSFASGVLNYDFTTARSKAYRGNLVLKGIKWCLYSGDVNQDGQVTFSDLIAVDNDNKNFVTGYTNTDVTGDNQVTFNDLIIIDNNNSNFIGKIVPTGAPTAIKVNGPVKIKTLNEQQ